MTKVYRAVKRKRAMQKRKISELDSKRKINKMKNEVELEAGTIDDIKPIFRVVI